MKSDLELVAEVKAGDAGAFSELVLRHQKALLRLSLRWVKDLDLAEDVVQDSFIKAYQKIHLFEERASFKSWLFRIAINTANNKLRSESGYTVDVDRVHMIVGAEAEKSLVLRDIQVAVANEVNKLPERQKLALTLRVFEDLSFHEIAEAMECPYDTAKANYRHALLRLKTTLEKTDLLQTIESLNNDDGIKLKEFFSEVDQ